MLRSALTATALALASVAAGDDAAASGSLLAAWGWEDVLDAALRLNQTMTYANGDQYVGEMM